MVTDIGRVSTYAVFQTTLTDSSNVEAELATLQNQLSSGQKSQNYQGISEQSQQYIDLNNQISKSSQYVTNNNLVSTRLDATDSSLTDVINAATSLSSLIQTQETGTTGSNNSFDLQVQQQWQSIVSALNTTSGGQYIFSGTATNQPSVDATNFPTIDPTTGAANTDYYQGSDQDITLRADDSTQITYTTRANSQGIQDIMTGLALAKQGNDSGSTLNLQQAYTYVQKGMQEVIATQSSVNSNKVSLSTINTNQQNLQLYWQGVQQSIGNTDLVSVSTQVAVDQGILQASFQAFAKINSLSLADYLK